MKNLHKLLLGLFGILVLSSFLAFAQGGHHCGGHFDPDSLTEVTVSGTAIVDSTVMHPMYYLDEDGDGQADYHLNFGPWWYQPDSSNATRPNHGDLVTITGGLWDSTMIGVPTIVVYEINGEFWRDPYNGFWNNMGHHSHNGGHHQGGCNGYAFGWMHDTLETMNVSGTAIVDTTFMFEMYYLDETGDSIPEYHLNFGPPWYQPPSGAARPNDGDTINILGGMLDDLNPPMIIVYEINGQVWRDSTGFGHHFAGQWFQRNMTQPQTISTPFDPNGWMQINPGWHPGGMMMPDSLFGQMLEMNPYDLPFGGAPNAFAGYEMGIFYPNGNNGMWGNGGCGGMMMFNSQTQFQLHYNDIQIQGFNIDENTIQVKYWNQSNNSWTVVSGATIDPVNNTVTFSRNQLSNFFILTGAQNPLAINDNGEIITKEFTLRQNYPNPFNPGTTIEFELKQRAQVVLTIYNTLGQKLFKVLDEPMSAGAHTVYFDGKSLPSGIYFYELKANGQSRVMRMNLIK